MDDQYRNPDTEALLKEFGLRWRWEDAVPFGKWASIRNPVRWKERYDGEHATEIGLAMLDGRAVPAVFLYQPPGATLYDAIGGHHRREAAEGTGRHDWPAYVIEEPIDEFLFELLSIMDNVGGKKSYDLNERLELASHLLVYGERDLAKVAHWLQIKNPKDIRDRAELQAALAHAEECGVTTQARKLAPNVTIAVHKAFPKNDPLFTELIKTLEFCELSGNAAKSVIKDVQEARSEAAALKHLADLYEKHRAELEKIKKLGRPKRTPTTAQKLRERAMRLQNAWPGRVELLEINTHDDDLLSDLEARARDVIEFLMATAERCAEVLAMRAKLRTP